MAAFVDVSREKQLPAPLPYKSHRSIAVGMSTTGLKRCRSRDVNRATEITVTYTER